MCIRDSGKGIALQLAREGAIPVVLNRKDGVEDEFRAEISEITKTFEMYYVDLNDTDAIKPIVEEVYKKYGHIDGVVNNAGRNDNLELETTSWQDFEKSLHGNLTHYFELVHETCPYLKESKGSIVNIASTRASMSQKDTESYSAAKGALISLTHALAMSLAPLGVRVNSISPGWIDTGAFGALSPEDGLQHPAGRVGTPEDIVQAVFFLCRSGFVNAENLVIDGGMTRMMVYHGDEGWTFRPEPPDTVPS